MGKKELSKPRGRLSAYAFFVQTCRDEHKKRYPDETIVFSEFSRECGLKWKTMVPKAKRRFEGMSEKDKLRYEQEMEAFAPSSTDRKKKRKKDPNAPKRPMSAFIFFCQDGRSAIRAENPSWSIGQIAKEMGRKWEFVENKPKYERLAENDKKRYIKDMAIYKAKEGKIEGKTDSKKPSTVSVTAPVKEEDDEEAEVGGEAEEDA